MTIFGDLAVRLDPWQVDYGGELLLDDAEEPAPEAAPAQNRSSATGARSIPGFRPTMRSATMRPAAGEC